MKGTLPPAEMLRRWTRHEYDRLVELGAFQTGERLELIDGSYRIDHEFKTSLYARAAVPECWIVDGARSVAEVHRSPEQTDTAPYGWRYANVDTLPPSSTITPLLAHLTTIAVADLLPYYRLVPRPLPGGWRRMCRSRSSARTRP
jgi:hypothetical protein